MNLSYLIERAAGYSARGDVLGWMSLAADALEELRDQRLDDFLRTSLGISAPPATPRARLDHVGLTFLLSPDSVVSLDEIAGAAGLEKTARPKETTAPDRTARFPSVLLARTLAHCPETQNVDVEVFKTWKKTAWGQRKIEILLLCADRDKHATLRSMLGPSLHLAFATESPEVHNKHARQLEDLGLSRPLGGAANNPHEGLFSSYFDGESGGSPLRLELCYSTRAGNSPDGTSPNDL